MLRALPLLLTFPSLALLVLPTSVARAQSKQPAQCRAAIASAELVHRIPEAFLSAIAKVESGRPIDGMVVAWPWTINAEGNGAFFATKEDAIAAVRSLQARGIKSIDVGCMQVNLQQHPEAFRSLDQAFDPTTNAAFAAGLLVSLFSQVGSWPLAAAAYHSQTPTIGAAYQKQVLAAWAQPDRPGRQPAKAAGHSSDAAQPDGAPPAMETALVQASLGFAGGPAFGRQTGFHAGGQPRAPGLLGSSRGLDAYRQTPVRLAFRPPVRPG